MEHLVNNAVCVNVNDIMPSGHPVKELNTHYLIDKQACNAANSLNYIQSIYCPKTIFFK